MDDVGQRLIEEMANHSDYPELVLSIAEQMRHLSQRGQKDVYGNLLYVMSAMYAADKRLVKKWNSVSVIEQAKFVNEWESAE